MSSLQNGKYYKEYKNFEFNLAPPDGLEPPTLKVETSCSNPLSYGGKLRVLLRAYGMIRTYTELDLNQPTLPLVYVGM